MNEGSKFKPPISSGMARKRGKRAIAAMSRKATVPKLKMLRITGYVRTL